MTAVKPAREPKSRPRAGQAAANGSVAPAGGVRLSSGRERRMPVAALGVIVLVGAMFGFALWSSSLGHRSSVLVASRDIAAGSVISSGDLRRADVGSGAGVATVPASQADVVVGQVARVTIVRGGLLTRSQFGSGTPIGVDEAVVGVVLPDGAVPVPDLRVGQRVEVVAAASSGQSGGPATSDRGSADGSVVASVYAVHDTSAQQGQGTAVSLVVDRAEAASVAALAGSGQVRLVLLADGTAPRSSGTSVP